VLVLNTTRVRHQDTFNLKKVRAWYLMIECWFKMLFQIGSVKEMFQSYRSINGGKVIINNNSVSLMKRISNTILKSLDGSERILGNNVRHVLDLKGGFGFSWNDGEIWVLLQVKIWFKLQRVRRATNSLL